MAKDVQNSARLLTAFDFDRKYLQNASTKFDIIKLGKARDQLQPSHIARKRLVYFGPQKVMGAHVDPSSGLFFGRLYFDPFVCCRL